MCQTSVTSDTTSFPPKILDEDAVHALSKSLGVSSRKGSNSSSGSSSITSHSKKKENSLSPKPSRKTDKKKTDRLAYFGSEDVRRATSTRHLTKVSHSKSSYGSRSRSHSPNPVRRTGRVTGGLRRNRAYQKDSDLCSSTSSEGTASTVSTTSSTGSSGSRSGRGHYNYIYPKVNSPAMAPGPSILKNKTSSAESLTSSMTDSTTTTIRRRRNAARVSFDITEIREYPMILDEGNCDGPAMLTIDWEPQSTEVTTVQEHYLERCYDKEKRDAVTGQLRALQPNERAAILIRAGCNDIAYLCQSLALTESEEFKLGGHKNNHRDMRDVLKTAHPKKKKTMISKMKKKAKKVYGRSLST